MTAPEIIEAFGGTASVADLTGARPNAVTQWRRIGIPSKYWDVLVERAATTGIGGITFASLRASKPTAASVSSPPAPTPEAEAA